MQFKRLHHQVVAHGTDSKDRVAIVILVTVVMLVSVVMLVAAIMLQFCDYVTVVTNFLSTTVNYYTDILKVLNATY